MPEHLWIDQKHWGQKRVVIQERQRVRLRLAGDRGKAHAVLTEVLLLGTKTTDDGGHVIHLRRPLPDQTAVDALQIVVRVG